MKTIQEHLKTYDRDTLINAYCFKHAPSVSDPFLPDKKISEITDKLKEALNRSIDYLCSVEPKRDDDPCFLLAYHTINTEDISENVRFTMIPFSKMNDKILAGFSFILSPTEEIMGYYVSDAYTTGYYLEDLLVWFLHEATFFGYERERVEEEAEELDRRHQEVIDGTAELIPAEEVYKDLGLGTEWVPEERNKEEKEEEYRIQKIVGEFNHSCMKREMEETKKRYELSMQQNDKRISAFPTEEQ